VETQFPETGLAYDRETLLEIMFMTVCELLGEPNRKEVKEKILQLHKIRDAIDKIDFTIPGDS
jgi:hypothetical protein